MPTVSVIIPTHNRAEFLRTAINSVCAQTFTDWEAIVINDDSTDNTSEVVLSYKDRRINYIKNKGKNGPSVSRNIGINKALGEYVAFLDDDDEWLPEKLEKQVDILRRCTNDICGIYSNRLLIDRDTGKTFSENPGTETLKGNLLSQLLIKNPIHTSTLVIRKSCLEQVGLFDENMRYMEDRDLWIRLALEWDYEYIEEPLIKAYYHGNSHLSRDLRGQIKGREIILQRYENLLKTKRKSWGKLKICLGAQYCQMGEMKQGRMNLIKGIMIYPFSKMAFFHFFTSLLGAENYRRIRRYYKTSQLS